MTVHLKDHITPPFTNLGEKGQNIYRDEAFWGLTWGQVLYRNFHTLHLTVVVPDLAR